MTTVPASELGYDSDRPIYVERQEANPPRPTPIPGDVVRYNIHMLAFHSSTGVTVDKNVSLSLFFHGVVLHVNELYASAIHSQHMVLHDVTTGKRVHCDGRETFRVAYETVDLYNVAGSIPVLALFHPGATLIVETM